MKNEVRGTLQLKGNIGFVEPNDRRDGEEDFYIGAEDLGDAMDGDEVLVEPIRRRGRTAGRIVRVLRRRATIVAGTIDVRGREPVLVTEQATDPVRLTLSEGMDRRSLTSGLGGIAEITEYPTPWMSARGRLVKILGPRGGVEVELELSRAARRVPKQFPPDVLAEARRLSAGVTKEDLKDRMDLRKLRTFTIDPVDARDFDDAISIEPLREAGFAWRIGIHIADVSAYVPPDSAIDREAFERGTSTYLPGEVIPMLPFELSNGICSLVEGQDRLTVSVFVDFTETLRPGRFRHGRSVIRSQRRFTYEEVDGILEGGRSDFRDDLLLLRRIAQALSALRIDRGAVDLDIPEQKPVLGLDGKVMEIRTVARTWSHRLIEELMILANEHVARQLERRGIFRVHEPPDPERILRLRTFAAALGRSIRGGGIMRFLESFRGSPAQRVIEILALRSMQEARYSADNIGHYGLASEAYTHFTSPIRRYPDLVVHRLLVGDATVKNLPAVARQSSAREREAMQAERDALLIKYLEYAETKLGEEVEGTIDGLGREGVFLLLDFGPRGFVPIQELGRDNFRYDREAMLLVGRRTGRRFRLGDRMHVVIVAVDMAARMLYLEPRRTDAAPRARRDGEGWRAPASEERPERNRKRGGRGRLKNRGPGGRKKGRRR